MNPIFLVFLVGVWLLLECGCASMHRKNANLSELDRIESDLRADPKQEVDSSQIREESAQFEAEEETFSTMTPEKFGKRVKIFFLTLVNLEPDQAAAVLAFGQGVELFDRGEFEKAADKLWYAYFRWPDSPLQEDAIFLRAESFFFANHYAKAEREYERLLKKYDSTRYLDRVSPRLFAIGQYWDKMDQANRYGALSPNFTDKTRPFVGTYGECLKAYKAIFMHDPNGLWAEHALMAAGNACYLRGQYVEASQYYDDLIRNYPQTKHLLQACELNLSAKLLMYQGPEYDGKPLEDADKLAERLLHQFDTQLGPRKQAIVATRNKIVDAKAERDLGFAKFYETKRLYGAARYYYMLVMNDYPQSVASEYARERYDVIKDYRAEPVDYFAWLKKIFPEK
ncbi:MAG: outer membrane protein assembly factor BamD [Planctomycetia bacterium]|nr:outer membrane protein assembly factor BamD [Planctomycetia bacterium]